MTWHYTVNGSTIDIYDRTGALVADDRAFSGSWSDYPDVVLDVMSEAYDEQAGQGNSRYRQDLLRDAALENIEEGTP